MKRFTKKLVTCSLFLILFIDGLGISIILPLFSDMFLKQDSSILSTESTIGFRNFFYGLSLVSFSLGMFFSAPILGQLSDKFGRKRILLYSLWGTSIGYILSGVGVYIKSPGLFILGRIIDGLTAGSIPVAQAVISEVSPKDKKVANIGLVLFAVTLGYMLGPLIAKFLSRSSQGNTYIPFFAVALLSLVSIICLLPLRETPTFPTKGKIDLFLSFNTLVLLRKVKNAKVAISAFLLFQLGWTMYFQYVPHFLTASTQKELVTSILTVIGIGMSLSFCLLTRMFQHKWRPIMGSMLTVFLMTLSILSQILFQMNVSILITCAWLGALGYGLGYSFFLTYLSEIVNKELQGLIMGIAASMSALASVTTALLGSILVNFSFQCTYISAIIFLTLCLLSLSIEKKMSNL